MKRRSKAGGKASKARHRNALKPKRRDASKTASSSAPIQDAEVARLTRELNEASEQQAATSEVLRVISAFSGELQRVFQSMLENATRLCDAKFGMVFRFDGDAFVLAAEVDTPPAFAEYEKRRGPFKPVKGSHLARVMRTKEVSHTADYAAEGVAAPPVELGGARSTVDVPMLKNNELIGAFSIYRQEVRPFTNKQIELVKNFAAQAVIAIENARLLNELRQRTNDLTERTADLTEALEQQTASSDVLRVISSSPGDLKPVFDAMLASAARICDATFGSMVLCDEDAYRRVALHNAPQKFSEYINNTPIIRRGMAPGIDRVIDAREVVHIRDLAAESPDEPIVKVGGAHTILAVPLLKENEAIGVIAIYRQEVRPFTDKQIELVQNFAAQAVIAIENARLLNELRQRTTDLTEALEQQTATSGLLQVISGSPGNLEPVFQAMLENAVGICGANFGNMFLYEDDAFRTVAMFNAPEAYANARMGAPLHPPSDSGLGRLVATKEVVQIADLRTVERYVIKRDPFVVAAVELAGIRTLLAVPMLKEGRLVGAIVIYRQEVRPFGEKQTELVKNFASQVVIAIENARLLNELRERTTDLTERTADLTEALEQQTATSDVLKVISSSPGDLQPVFDTMLANATRLCEATHGHVWTFDGEQMYAVAVRGDATFVKWLQDHNPVRPIPGSAAERIVRGERFVHVGDRRQEPAYRDNRTFRELVDTSGIRASLSVALRKGETLLGMINVYRQDARPFTDNQIKLVEDFASQAVIAIENARLLNELRQSLEQQTATSDVLKVISRSAFDLQAVLETLVASAAQLCRAERASITLPKGENYQRVASYGFSAEFREFMDRHPLATERGNIVGRVVLEGRTIQIDDVEADPDFTFVEATRLGKVRTLLGVPLMRQGKPIGVLVLSRGQVEPFSNRNIELVETFADQAVIAIENARLVSELRERTGEVEKLNKDLEHRVADQVGEIERMGRLRRFLPPQVADLIVASGMEKQLESHRREITALFCDLRGFTGFSESADPEDVMTVLREYHEALGASIIRYSGTLERYAGDGVMVVFNDPVPVQNPALQAVLMALEMRDAIGALTETWHRWGHEIGFGIGIAHGFATLGTIGFEGRFDYAAIGTVSNVASRLCDEAKPGQILISPRVLTKVENAVKVEPVGEFVLKGIRRPLAAYNVLSATPTQI